MLMVFAANGSAQVPGFYHPAQLYRADFYPESIVQMDGLRRAWTRITYMADVTDKQGDLTVHAHVGDVEYVFHEYDCQKKLVRVENLFPHGVPTVAAHSRASDFYTPAPASLEESALEYFCRPVAPHSASSRIDKFWIGRTKPWKDENAQ
jgi:hypothetical protein